MTRAPQREPEKPRQPRGELSEQAWKQNETTWNKKLKSLILLRVFDDLGGELG